VRICRWEILKRVSVFFIERSVVSVASRFSEAPRSCGVMGNTRWGIFLVDGVTAGNGARESDRYLYQRAGLDGVEQWMTNTPARSGSPLAELHATGETCQPD
jgi:hypothetical protein